MVAIFHASDLTAAGAQAFRHALRLAVGEGNKLTVMHVHGRGKKASTWEHYPRVRETLNEWGLDSAHATAGMAVRKVEAEGNSVARALIHHISRHTTDLIVLASEGRDGFSGFVKQSIAHRVVREAKIPALLLPNGCDGFVGRDGSINLHRILVGAAPKPDPQLSVDAAVWLAELCETGIERFTVAHAGRHAVDVALPDYDGAESIAIAGEPVKALLDLSARMQADLIVLNSEGRKGFSENFTGSFTEQICSRAACPVLILPAPDYRTAPAV